MLTMFTRRQFVRAGAAAAATVLVPPVAAAKPRRRAGLVTDARFPQGVLSGDPSKIRSPYADAVRTMEFVMACNRSMETGLPVRVEHH